MTDNEIIKALECCTSYDCEHCKYEPPILVPKSSLACNDALMKDALDLINRQRAEIEEKSNKLREIMPIVAELKTEAVKEFAERLKAEKWKHKNFGELVCVEDIDSLLKEMVGEQK